MIQLGAYGNQAFAKDAWKRLSKRFTYLEPLPMSIEQAEVGGSTVYRLRAAAGGPASTLCGKPKVAGQSCMVVHAGAGIWPELAHCGHSFPVPPDLIRGDRKSAVSVQSVSVRVDLGGLRILNNNKKQRTQTPSH